MEKADMREVRSEKTVDVNEICCGLAGQGQLTAACSRCGKSFHVKDDCLRFLPAAERKFFIAGVRASLKTPGRRPPDLLCCSSPASRDIADEY